jgi:hypothetical protein
MGDATGTDTAIFIDDSSVSDDPFQDAPATNNGLRPFDGPQDVSQDSEDA